MATSEQTFDPQNLPADLTQVDPRATLRPPLEGLSGPSGLPHLTVGDDDIDGEPRHDLTRREQIGAGGMGVVWLADQASLDRRVAIKQVRPGAGPSAAAALLREARFMGRLEHPNIVPAHALGLDHRGEPVLVMKYVEGTVWKTLIEDPHHPWWAANLGPGQSRLERHLVLLIELCRAVHHAHVHGVVHRDLKPDNVVIGPLGEVHLMDWGVAVAIPDGGAINAGVVGTPSFMAPEMVDPGALITVRTDVYLLGALLHAVLTGQPRHPGGNVMMVLLHAQDSPPFAYGPDVPPDLADLANRCCARHADLRPDSVLTVQQGLQTHLRLRQAFALAEAARRDIEALDRALASADWPSADRLFTEIRFGLRQALRESPDQPQFRADLAKAFSRVIRPAILRGELDRAHAWLDELVALDPTQGAEVRAEVALALAERDRLDKLAADHDASLHAQARVIAQLVVLVLVGTAVIGAIILRSAGAPYGHRQAMGFLLMTFTMFLAAMFFARRIAFSNAINRTISMTLVGAYLVMILNRAMSWHNATPLHMMFTLDLAVLTLACVAIGQVVPSLLWAFPVLLTGMACLWVFPDQHVFVFGITTLASLGANVLAAAVRSRWPR